MVVWLLVQGVFHGVTGVVTKPIEGAKHEGVGGFFKGITLLSEKNSTQSAIAGVFACVQYDTV